MSKINISSEELKKMVVSKKPYTGERKCNGCGRDKKEEKK